MSDVTFPTEKGYYFTIVNLPPPAERPDPRVIRAPVQLKVAALPVPTEYNCIVYYEPGEQTMGLLDGSVSVERRAPRRIPSAAVLAFGPKIEVPAYT
jgi:hypothetical protein